MKSEEQRIAIACAVGTHTLIHVDEGHVHVVDEKGRIWQIIDHPDGSHSESLPLDFTQIPDYLNDLNAMHEAESVILRDWKAKTHTDWMWNLCLACGVDYYDRTNKETTDMLPGKLARLIAHATAAQRAEAFLRTLNLWKE